MGRLGREGAHDAQLAAVLVPLYRRLLQREAAVAAHAADALAAVQDASGVTWPCRVAVADPSPGLRAVAEDVDALGRVRGPEALMALRLGASNDPSPPFASAPCARSPVAPSPR